MVGRGEDDPLVSVPGREVDHRVCRFDHYLSYPNHLILHHRYLDEDVLRARDSRFRYYRDLHRHSALSSACWTTVIGLDLLLRDGLLRKISRPRICHRQ
jgi:hypothetical protein